MIQDARPFLPEPDPDPAPVKPKQAKKTLLLWGLLIVMFLVIWQVLQPSPSSQSTRPEPVTAPCEDTWSFGRATLVLGPILFSVFFVSWIVRAYGSARTFNREADPGLVALAERRLSVAAETFEALAAKHAKKPGHAAAAWTNVALTQLAAGQLDLALQSLARVERTLGLPRASGVRLRAAQELVLVHALTGDLETAQRWADDARKRLAATLDNRNYYGARLCLGEAIVAIRRGDSAGAISLLEKNWLVLRATLDANAMRVAEVVRAFAEVGGGVRQYNVVQERLIRVEPVIGTEFGFLGARWPEMQAFLVAHGMLKELGVATS